MNELEKKLSGIPLRELPPSWRGSILVRARASAGKQAGWTTWLWPSPRVWAAMAACWMAAGALFFAGPQPSGSGGPADAVALARDLQVLRERGIVSAVSINDPHL